MESKNKVFVDHSILYKPYWYVVALIMVAWVAYVVWIWQEAIARQVVPWVDGALQLAILWYMINTVTTKVEYRLEPEALVMTKRYMLRPKEEIRLPYEEIFGVHHFKNQLMKPVTYRYTFHMYSKMDDRTIWSLLYRYGDSTKKVGRVLMKGSEPFWQAFEKKLPGQIRVPQEEVLAHTYKHMGAIERAKNPDHQGEELDFEEGIKQLRQEGTEMGGRGYEVTGEDFKDRPEAQSEHSREVEHTGEQKK